MACQASCHLLSQQTAASTVVGTLKLSQAADGSLSITGSIANLTPGKHGLKICTWGDPTASGPIFNPFGQTHGAPADSTRMVGDLGNVLADETGNATVDIKDTVAQLIGPHSILGRSIVVAAGEDDQGRGGHENSLVTGNAGPVTCAGVIGLCA